MDARASGPVSLLVKPASGMCNLRCEYCFYRDELANRERGERGLMSLETLEAVVSSALKYARGSCTFGFQGGEPTLAGLHFFRALMELEKKYNTGGVRIYNSLQTNGTLLDEEWARFLHDSRFLVGLSLDGDRAAHDMYRLDASGGGTFAGVLRAAKLMDKYKVEYNILTVVTAQCARHIGRLYSFFVRGGFMYQQYIPCLDPLGGGKRPYSLTSDGYAKFLRTLFDAWFADIARGMAVSVRYFDNLVGMRAGRPPESCGLSGVCAIQHVIESDGSVYPCDFYALDDYLLGNIKSDGLNALHESARAREFIDQSRARPKKCLECRYSALCNDGCRRERGEDGLNKYCEAYSAFFDYALPRIDYLASRAARGG